MGLWRFGSPYIQNPWKKGFLQKFRKFWVWTFYFCPFLNNTKLSFRGLLKNYFVFPLNIFTAFSVWFLNIFFSTIFEKYDFLRFSKNFKFGQKRYLVFFVSAIVKKYTIMSLHGRRVQRRWQKFSKISSSFLDFFLAFFIKISPTKI